MSDTLYTDEDIIKNKNYLKEDKINMLEKIKQLHLEKIYTKINEFIKVNNTLIIENNTCDEINLCDFLQHKTKKICDKNGNIKNIRYTDITNIIFINCNLISISKYYTGIILLNFINCPHFKNMSRYLKAELKYLIIDSSFLIGNNRGKYINYIDSLLNKKVVRQIQIECRLEIKNLYLELNKLCNDNLYKKKLRKELKKKLKLKLEIYDVYTQLEFYDLYTDILYNKEFIEDKEYDSDTDTDIDTDND